MALDKSKYVGKFVEEGLENISIVETLLFEIKEGLSLQENLVTLLRALHTLKGSARMLEFKNVETLTHSLESAFISLKESKIALSDDATHLFLACLDELKNSLSLIKSGKEDGTNPEAFQKELLLLSENQNFNIPGKVLPQTPIQEEIVSKSEEKSISVSEISQDQNEKIFSKKEEVLPIVETLEIDIASKSSLNIDKSKYIAKFIEEGLENILTVETLLFEIRNGTSVQDDLAMLFRSLHILKGTARILDFKNIESITHALETVFSSLKEERIMLNDKAIRLILASLDELKNGINQVKETKKDKIETQIFQKELLALSANEDFNVPNKEDATKAQLKSQIQNEKNAVSKREKLEETKSESIRISLERIDEIIHSMAALQSLEIAARNIARDTETINVSSKQFSHGLGSNQAWNSPLLQEFRSMELMISKLGSFVKNYAVDVGNHIRGAYNSVISLRMLPLSTALDAYPRYVFTIASELGKKVRINIEGAENEIDKNLIESLSEVFLHMIRNSIDHGIEKPEDRKAVGKNETGLISIRCIRESGNMKIILSDDGKGIDIERIRQKVVENGLVAKEAALALTEGELINFIFQSGFSTAKELSNVSGRGVGMDAVRNNIERMKGSIAIQSKFGEGTIFTISVPLSMASLMGFPIMVGDMKFIIPTNFVDTVLLIHTKEIITIVDRPGIKYNGRIIKLFYLNHILKITENKRDNDSDSIFVVIVQAYEETVALTVNNISSMRQVILKTMPSFLEHIEMFSGVVLNEDYEMVPALHIPTIIKMAKRTKTIDMKKRHIDYERSRKSILVIDDSQPTRDIERDILQAEGYKVDTASDGSEGLAMAKNVHYDLICTDVAMPNMDGFMLTENIRKNNNLKDIPIIIVSSKISEKDQNKAILLGVNRYIIKSSFSSHNLVSTVRELIGEANG